jgi:hypothetical protein
MEIDFLLQSKIKNQNHIKNKLKDGCWIESTSKYSRAKILISEEWVSTCCKNAPELVILDDREKFRDIKNILRP